MLHPSYTELMQEVNKNVEEGDSPIVNSRYSIVLGTAKRARQLVAADISSYEGKPMKPLSIAVEELRTGRIKILSQESENYEDYEDEKMV